MCSGDYEQVVNEVNLLKGLDHPNILTLYGFYEDDSNCYIVTDLCKGGELWDELAEKAQLGTKILSSISYRTSQDTSQHIPSSIIGRDSSIGNGKTQGTNVIGNDSVGHVLVSNIVRSDLSRVGFWIARQCLDFFKERLKDIRVVVGIDALQNTSQALKPHPGIDVLGG